MEISKSDLLGHIDADDDQRFTEVITDDIQQNVLLRHEAAEAFEEMRHEAQLDGVELIVVSGFRSFNRQKLIWENKWHGKVLTNGLNLALSQLSPLEKAKAILKYSAMPGTSRHHWGTDIDLNSVEPEYFESGEGEDVLSWLLLHANKFGFAMPYTSKLTTNRSGYESEPWHWSFLPLAREMHQNYLESIGYKDLIGFEGCDLAEELRTIETYVNGVANTCLPMVI